jgi:ubiquilin
MLAQNPEMMLELLQMNPKMKALMERNPQIRHALSDPSTLQEILATGSDPRVYQEAMRGHDRALANIENIPGGFQALQQFYTKEPAEVETGIGEMHLHQRVYEGQQTRNVQPMPNPWKRPTMDNANDETQFKEQLESMRQMGFTDTQENIQALLACNGNVDSAIDKILSNRYL